MIMTQKKMGEELKTIAGIKNQIKKLNEEEVDCVEQIKAIEISLMGIRYKRRLLDNKLLNSCDQLFNDTYGSLPNE